MLGRAGGAALLGTALRRAAALYWVLHWTTRPPARNTLHTRHTTPRVPGTSAMPAPAVYTSDFLEFGAEQESSLGLIILNRPLPQVTAHLWRRASIRICADGGANRLHDELPRLLPSMAPQAVREMHLPDLITGDLDSIRLDVTNFYRSQGVPLVDLSADQMTNDLDKCLKGMERMRAQRGQQPGSYITIAAGGLGGRLDHTLANLSALYAHRDTRLVLCGDGNLARLIPKGHALIRPCRPIEGPTCGLVPLQGQAVGNSSGLRWNLDHTRLAVGELISTSNIMEADEIRLEADSDLVWTTEYDDAQFLPVID